MEGTAGARPSIEDSIGAVLWFDKLTTLRPSKGLPRHMTMSLGRIRSSPSAALFLPEWSKLRFTVGGAWFLPGSDREVAGLEVEFPSGGDGFVDLEDIDTRGAVLFPGTVQRDPVPNGVEGVLQMGLVNGPVELNRDLPGCELGCLPRIDDD